MDDSEFTTRVGSVHRVNLREGFRQRASGGGVPCELRVSDFGSKCPLIGSGDTRFTNRFSTLV